MTGIVQDPSQFGFGRWGQFKWGENQATSALISRPASYRVEIRSAGGGTTLLATTANLLDGSIEVKANACGVCGIVFPDDDPVWTYIVKGNEVWVYPPNSQRAYIHVIQDTNKEVS